MNENKVSELSQLAPMRVASVHGFGPEPEGISLGKTWGVCGRKRTAKMCLTGLGTLASIIQALHRAVRIMAMSSGSQWDQR